MFWKLEGIKAHANIGLDFSTRIWVGFVVIIPSSIGHFQWWHLIMAKVGSFCHLKINIQELWWLFNVVCVGLHCYSCFWFFVQCQTLSFYLSSLILCLLIFAFVYIFLLIFTSLCFNFYFSSLCFYFWLVFASIFFCLPMFGLYLCLPLFAYVCFYLPLFIYVLLNSKSYVNF